jgi:hypothetical protein
MKKKFYLLLILILFGSTTLFGAHPIPSYDVPVYYKANFLEKPGTSKLRMANTKGKRTLTVKVYTNPGTTTWVWFYSIDGLSVLGPYVVSGEGQISVEIDDRDWGVYIETDGHVIVDVWSSPIP